MAFRVRRNCSHRVPGDKMFIDNLVKYKAYLLNSGYASDIIDKHFIKVAKLKQRIPKEKNLLGTGKLILSQHGIRCFLTSIKLSGNFIIFWKRTNSAKNIFPKGSFRVSYIRGHKHLKEFLVPNKVVFETWMQ